MVHVDLETCKEHEVEKSHLSENGKRRIIGQNIEPVGSHGDARHNHAYDVGYLQLVEQDRRKKDDGQYDKKYLYGLGHECLLRHGCHRNWVMNYGIMNLRTALKGSNS